MIKVEMISAMNSMKKYNNLFEKGDFSVLQEISESTISYMSYHPLPGSIDNISSTISRAKQTLYI